MEVVERPDMMYSIVKGFDEENGCLVYGQSWDTGGNAKGYQCLNESCGFIPRYGTKGMPILYQADLAKFIKQYPKPVETG